jgi:hypothetical protein
MPGGRLEFPTEGETLTSAPPLNDIQPTDHALNITALIIDDETDQLDIRTDLLLACPRDKLLRFTIWQRWQ